jgi:hypothetical protein
MRADSPEGYSWSVPTRGADTGDWSDTTEELARSIPEPERWPGDDRDMVRVSPVLKMDVAVVTRADYARFVAATGYQIVPRKRLPILDDATHLPVVAVDIEDARAYARWAGKRLPLENEWLNGVISLGATMAGVGVVWEWTASRHKDGHVVRGGPFRDQPGTQGSIGHRSWEDRACRDVGFRCVVDG